MFKNRLKKFRGESLVETIIAVFIISVGATASLALLVSAFMTTSNVENRVVAINLAREGIEAVRNVRDSNWIQHGGERREFWNCIGDENCTEKIDENKQYVVDFDMDNLRWVLYSTDYVLDLSDGENNEDKFFLLLENESEGEGKLYTHDKIEGGACLSDSPPTCRETVFFREVSFDYIDDDKQDVLEVFVKVEWWDGGNKQDVELVTYITDFLGRDYNTIE